MAESLFAIKPSLTPGRRAQSPTAPIRFSPPTLPMAPPKAAVATSPLKATLQIEAAPYENYAAAPVTPDKSPSLPIRDAAAEVANTESWFAGAQTLFQGAVRSGVQVLKGAKAAAASRFVAPVADFLEGGKTTVNAGQAIGRALSGAASKGVDLLGKGGSALARAAGLPKVVAVTTDLAAKAAPKAAAVGSFAGKALGATARVVGKVAPALNVVSSTWETVKAFKESDPVKKRGAVANATLSWASTGAAIGAIAVGATPVGWGLAAGAAAVAGFQLVDTAYFDGKGTQWIGDTAAKTWEGTKSLASGAWKGSKSLASGAWEGTKSLASKLKFW